jgi:hypothetical protein
LLLAACASEPTQSPAAEQQPQQPHSLARTCDSVAVTGSRINRCDRTSVQLMTPEAFSNVMTTPAAQRIGN